MTSHGLYLVMMMEGAFTVIACATVAEELRCLDLPEDRLRVLDFGLHLDPDRLRLKLQEQIDSLPGGRDVLLGYGLCSNALVGLSSQSHRLVAPRVDDCIDIFLGSRREREIQQRKHPGTYFLTKGWIEAADLPHQEYLRLAQRYGEARARMLIRKMLAHYTRILLIDTGNYRMDEYRKTARQMACQLGLAFEEIRGSDRLLRKLLRREWDQEFVVAEPGRELGLAGFLR